MLIKSIELVGHANVRGVINYGAKKTVNGYDNHISANIDNKDVDFTSSNCLRHYLFLDLEPYQLSSEDLKKSWVKRCASVGIWRGGLAPSEGQLALKRNSPLHIADAYSTEAKQIFFQQCTSSVVIVPNAGKESKKKSTNIFSRDNAPERLQNLSAIFYLEKLQFIFQGERQDCFVPLDEESTFLKELKTYFANALNVKTDFKIDNYSYKGNSDYKFRGIKFNKKETSALILDMVQRISNLRIHKVHGYFKTNKQSLNIKILNEHNEIVEMDLNSFIEDLKAERLEFYDYFV
jgi:hypothetical protein